MARPVSVEPERMQCMEIWGGNRAIDKKFTAPGLDIYVHSTPYDNSQTGGGDIYYLTSCASGRISRLMLADVSGHGESASAIAISLRDLLRKNVNRISQGKFVSRMNREFGALGPESGFATAVVATFFKPRKRLEISVAGHPPPLYYRAKKQQWVHLDSEELVDKEVGNLPLGVINESNYPGQKYNIEMGDMFLLYSDAFIESSGTNYKSTGVTGMLSVLNQAKDPIPENVIPLLRENLVSAAAGKVLDDDATLILGHFTPGQITLRDNFLAPFRMFGSVIDKTQFEG